MRKYTWLIGILVLAMVFVAGCGKKQSSSVVSTGGAKGTSAPIINKPVNTLADLMDKQKSLSSYTMLMDLGQTKVRMSAKMSDGKPVAMKMDMGQQGWMLILVDKKVQYMYNPTNKTAMSMPLSDSQMASATKDPIAQLKAMVGAKVSSEKVDGVDCLKIVAKEGTFWCSKDNGLPIQLDVTGKIMKFKYENINSVPDSEFELPAGVKITQMPAMPK